jgi:GNAT superfamily N-acetyltransferase
MNEMPSRAGHFEVSGDEIAGGAIADLLSLAVGGEQRRLNDVIQRYRDDPSAKLLVAFIDEEPAGAAGFTVAESEITLLHIATAPGLRRGGVGTGLLAAVRQSIPGLLSIVAETDGDALGSYVANGFNVTSLGEKYPGVDRFAARHEIQGAVDGR